MPGTKNRVGQPPANARVRQAAHREREARNHRVPSPERQARLHPSRAEKASARAWAANAEFFDSFTTYVDDRPGPIRKETVEAMYSAMAGTTRGGVRIIHIDDSEVQAALDAIVPVAAVATVATTPLHPLPWRAPDVRTPSGWEVLNANGGVAEYARSRDKARARAKEVNDA